MKFSSYLRVSRFCHTGHGPNASNTCHMDSLFHSVTVAPKGKHGHVFCPESGCVRDFISISLCHQDFVDKTFLWSYVLKEIQIGQVLSDCLKFVGRKRNGQVRVGYWAQPISGLWLAQIERLSWDRSSVSSPVKAPRRGPHTVGTRKWRWIGPTLTQARGPTLQGCLFQEGIITSKLKTLTFWTTWTSNVYILHHFHQWVYFYYTHYSLLNAFQNTPSWWWMTFLPLSWTIALFWDLENALFTTGHLLLWWQVCLVSVESHWPQTIAVQR